jgi:hypothetical protein
MSFASSSSDDTQAPTLMAAAAISFLLFASKLSEHLLS